MQHNTSLTPTPTPTPIKFPAGSEVYSLLKEKYGYLERVVIKKAVYQNQTYLYKDTWNEIYFEEDLLEIPTQTPTLTSTPTLTNTPTRTRTSTPTNTPNLTPTNTPEPTPTLTNTNTPTLTNTNTPTLTNIPIPSCNSITLTGINADVTSNSAIKTSAGGWDSTAYSTETYTGPVSVTFQTSANGNYLMGGFSYNPTANAEAYTNTTYGLYIQNGFLEIYEYGGQANVPGSTITLSTDVWRVDYNGTNVKYYKNDNLIYTSSNPVTQPLRVFFALLTGEQGVTNICVRSTPTNTPEPTPTNTPEPTPTNTPTLTPTNTPTLTLPEPTLVTDGLVLHYDFSNPASYPGIDSDVFDLSASNNNGTVVNNYGAAISWVDDGNKSYFNWSTNDGGSGSNSFGGCIQTASANTYKDFTIVFQPDFTTSGIVGLFCIPNDKSLRFYDGNTWVAPNPGNGDDWAGGSPTTYYVNGQVSNSIMPGWNIFGGAKNNSNPAFPDTARLYIGTSGYQDRNMQGRIAVVLMYNRALTQQEQIQNYNFLKTRFGL